MARPRISQLVANTDQPPVLPKEFLSLVPNRSIAFAQPASGPSSRPAAQGIGQRITQEGPQPGKKAGRRPVHDSLPDKGSSRNEQHTYGHRQTDGCRQHRQAENQRAAGGHSIQEEIKHGYRLQDSALLYDASIRLALS